MSALTRLTAFLVVVALSSSSVVQSPSSAEKPFELLILHNNDMHARFEQTSQLSGTCSPADRELGKCYGGFPRVAYVVKEARRAAAANEGPPVLYLNAGDTYTGTAWFTIYKWKIAAEFLNALQPDAVSLGNHEFDEGVAGLVPFINNLTAPTLAANLILDDVRDLADEPKLKKSIIINIGENAIGIIGYLTPDTAFLAPRNKVKYEEEIIAISREVKALKSKGVKIFIALGHSGFEKDLEIAKYVGDLDVVIGGHSNTFLSNSNTTNEIPETPDGRYPTVVTQNSDRKVLVVQAYAYTKYLGKLHLTFDSDGEITKYDGEPLLLNQEVPRDPELLKIVKIYQALSKEEQVVGESLVLLNGDCRLVECNLGNLITDSVLNYAKRNNPRYYNIHIAVIQGGRIRTSIDHPGRPFLITLNDVLQVLPFSDTLSIVTMNGTVLKQALEHSVAKWKVIDSKGQYLQMSGIKVTYDLGKSPGSRVVDAKAICTKCDGMTDIQDSLEYKVFMPTFLAEGGDDYSIFVGLPKIQVDFSETTCLLDFLNRFSPVNPKVTNRITLINRNKITAPAVARANKSIKIEFSFTLIWISLIILYQYL